MKKVPRTVILWIVLGWVFVVLFPNPSVLTRSIDNIRHPNVDAAAVKDLAAGLPNDPRLIEQAVLNQLVPYEYDWRVNGVPWYFPTTAEVVRWKRGDCESRALLLASILKAKGIPYQLVMSFDHIWVDYPGKNANSLENSEVALGQYENGHFALHWPKNFHPWAEFKAQLDNYWYPMPLSRRLLLFGGVLLLLLINPIRIARRREDGFDVSGRLVAAPVAPAWLVPRRPVPADRLGSRRRDVVDPERLQ